MEGNLLLKRALQYQAIGLSVIPVPRAEKAARIRWKQYQTKRAGKAQLHKWFSGNQSNIAVVLGDVSGGVACRDFDEEGAYQQWAVKHPDLAERLPTVRTARGYHVYFLADVNKTQQFEDGELRGSGGYCLLPPSIHPSGASYVWLIEPNNKNLLKVDPSAEGLAEGVTNVTERTQITEKTQDVEERGREDAGIGGLEIQDFEEVLRATLPRRTGTRTRKLFDLARMLRSMPEYSNACPRIFKPAIREWHRQALPNINTKNFEETWIDFLKAWPKIKWKSGGSPMSDTFEKAKKTALPACALQYDDSKLHLLVAWCKVLQGQAGDNDFFLSARTAGKFLDVAPMTANRWLFLLVSDEILKIIEKGKLTRTGGIATRFRYVADENI